MTAQAPMVRMGKKMLTPQAWLTAALRVLARGGLGAVSIDGLTQELGVSRGSFYWHFANRDAFLEALLAHWEFVSTTDVLAKLRTTQDPRERLHRLFLAAYRDRESGLAYSALTAATDDARVKVSVRRVTQSRLAFLEETYGLFGQTAVLARRNALLAYSAYVGLYDIVRALPARGSEAIVGEELRAYLEHVCATLIPG
ncbi:MAG: TetR/AcrR family transcriptional regulator [Kofleriaceae bacterium]